MKQTTNILSARNRDRIIIISERTGLDLLHGTHGESPSVTIGTPRFDVIYFLFITAVQLVTNSSSPVTTHKLIGQYHAPIIKQILDSIRLYAR